MQYITVADVDAILGAGWAGSGDPDRAVMMANAWLGQHIKKAVSEPIPEPIKQAGAEVAKDAAAGRLYGAKETGITSKSVKAGEVSSSKTYSETARTYTAGESLALALIDPWLRARSGVFFFEEGVMTLRDEITADIAEAFDTDLADAVAEFTGSRFEPSGPPDPINQTQPGETITYTGRGVFGSYETEVSEALGILRTDIKLTALQAEVDGQPKVDDDIIRGAERYRIIHVGQDPTAATWTLQIRRV